MMLVIHVVCFATIACAHRVLMLEVAACPYCEVMAAETESSDIGVVDAAEVPGQHFLCMRRRWGREKALSIGADWSVERVWISIASRVSLELVPVRVESLMPVIHDLIQR